MTRDKRNGLWLARGRIDHLATVHLAERKGARPPEEVGVCVRGSSSSACNKSRAKKEGGIHFTFGQLKKVQSGRSSRHSMTVKTEADKPVLTYSKSRRLVALVTGMESQLDIFNSLWYGCATFLHFPERCKRSSFSLSPSCVAAFMKQRRMGLNDFIQRLATNSYACKQWVPSDSCFCSVFTGTLENTTSVCPLRKLCDLIWLVARLAEMVKNCWDTFDAVLLEKLSWLSWFFFFFQPWSSVYSYLESSPGCWAHEHKPLSSCKYICVLFLCLHCTIDRDLHTCLFTCLPHILSP